MHQGRESFGGRFAVIMTLAGSAIGLGNLWRFPYLVGEYGGAAFIIVYILMSFLISLPMFMAESVIGRRSRQNAIGAVRSLAPDSGWAFLGYLSVITPMIIVSYYSVVGGWSLNFLLKSFAFEFNKIGPEESLGLFGSFISKPWAPIICLAAFLGLSCTVVALGVKKGIEGFSKVSLPLLFVLVVIIAIYACSMPGAKGGVDFLIKPDFSKLTGRGIASALGQSFYSLSLGMGIVITYSSYVSKKENLAVSSLGTAISDLLFACLAGFAIMPAVFAAGIEPNSGPGLIFQSLPYTFSKMGVGAPWASASAAIFFFMTVLVAAMTSAISLVEVGVAYLVEEKGLRRGTASLCVFGGAFTLGVFASLSTGPIQDLKIFGKPFFDFLDLFCSNFLLLLGGMLAVLFVGWKMKKEDVFDEFTNGGTKAFNRKIFPLVYGVIKYVAPLALAIIFFTNFLGE